MGGLRKGSEQVVKTEEEKSAGIGAAGSTEERNFAS